MPQLPKKDGQTDTQTQNIYITIHVPTILQLEILPMYQAIITDTEAKSRNISIRG
jgi:hypothetical protein